MGLEVRSIKRMTLFQLLAALEAGQGRMENAVMSAIAPFMGIDLHKQKSSTSTKGPNLQRTEVVRRARG